MHGSAAGTATPKHSRNVEARKFINYSAIGRNQGKTRNSDWAKTKRGPVENQTELRDNGAASSVASTTGIEPTPA